MKEILVVTPTLGKRKSLAKTISSVREIGADYVDHIIITPADKVGTIKKEFGDIRCIADHSGKKGIYPALNYAFNILGDKYKYFTFVNDDDFWLPDYRILIDEMLTNHWDLVYGKVQFVDVYGNIIKKMACSSRFRDFVPLLHKQVVLFTQQAALFKKELFFSLGGFDEKYKLASDTKFWAQSCLLDIDYKYIPLECAAYTIQKGQLSSEKEIQKQEMADLINSLPKYPFIIRCLSVIRYRLTNLPVYIERVINSIFQ